MPSSAAPRPTCRGGASQGATHKVCGQARRLPDDDNEEQKVHAVGLIGEVSALFYWGGGRRRGGVSLSRQGARSAGAQARAPAARRAGAAAAAGDTLLTPCTALWSAGAPRLAAMLRGRAAAAPCASGPTHNDGCRCTDEEERRHDVPSPGRRKRQGCARQAALGRCEAQSRLPPDPGPSYGAGRTPLLAGRLAPLPRPRPLLARPGLTGKCPFDIRPAQSRARPPSDWAPAGFGRRTAGPSGRRT
jgi:hypothetical protein